MNPFDEVNNLPFSKTDSLPDTDHDHIPDPCERCPGCIQKCCYEPLIDEDDAFRLLRFLIEDIKHLEAEVVRWRQILLKHLQPEDADGLFDDIFSNLASPVSLYGFDTYDQYVKYCCNEEDPLDNPEHTALMLRLRDGVDETSIDYL